MTLFGKCYDIACNQVVRKNYDFHDSFRGGFKLMLTRGRSRPIKSRLRVLANKRPVFNT